jgi:uncharacterized protein (TIGR02646 family)
MKTIAHPSNPPIALQRAIDNGCHNWDSFSGKAAVSEVLARIQQSLCAYCQIRLDSGIGSHIEHVWPKHAHQNKTFEWENLVLSCTHSDVIGSTRGDGGVSCGHCESKSSWPAYDSRFIAPTEHDCERYFEYLAADGSVQPAKNLSPIDIVRARYTIDLLELNCRRLCRLRKDMLEEGYRIISDLLSDQGAIDHFLDCEFSETNHKLGAFITARRQHFEVFA